MAELIRKGLSFEEIVQQGETYLLLGDSKGTLFLFDAPTGKLLDSIELGANIEATPAVFENTLVVGTRGEKIFGVTIK